MSRRCSVKETAASRSDGGLDVYCAVGTTCLLHLRGGLHQLHELRGEPRRELLGALSAYGDRSSFGRILVRLQGRLRVGVGQRRGALEDLAQLRAVQAPVVLLAVDALVHELSSEARRQSEKPGVHAPIASSLKCLKDGFSEVSLIGGSTPSLRMRPAGTKRT